MKKNNLTWKEKSFVVSLALWGVALVAGALFVSDNFFLSLGFMWFMVIIWVAILFLHKHPAWQIDKKALPLVFGFLVLVSLIFTFVYEGPTPETPQKILNVTPEYHWWIYRVDNEGYGEQFWGSKWHLFAWSEEEIRNITEEWSEEFNATYDYCIRTHDVKIIT